MLENDELIEQFKKSLTATIKSIGKSNTIEVNFVKDTSSIDDQKINLIEPNLKSLKNNLSCLRAEADAKALEIRFHRKDIHQKYVSKNEATNEIFKAIEQAVTEVPQISFKSYADIKPLTSKSASCLNKSCFFCLISEVFILFILSYCYFLRIPYILLVLFGFVLLL